MREREKSSMENKVYKPLPDHLRYFQHILASFFILLITKTNFDDQFQQFIVIRMNYKDTKCVSFYKNSYNIN